MPLSSVRAKALLRAADPYKSALERAWAQHLGLLRAAGEVHWFGFECMKFELAPGAWYTPDFVVICPDGGIELHEVKGHMREAARLRLLVAADRYPFYKWLLVTRPKADWEVTEVAA